MTTYLTANLAYQLGGDRALLERLASEGDVLSLVECRTRSNEPIDVADVLGPDFKVIQNLATAATAGTALAVRRHAGIRVARHDLRRASRPGRNVQARYLLDATLVDQGRETALATGHRPLAATGRQDEFDRAVRDFARQCRNRRRAQRARDVEQLRWMFAGDINEPPRKAARRLGAPHVHGADVMTFIYSAGWGPVVLDDFRVPQSDHHVLTLTTKEPTR